MTWTIRTRWLAAAILGLLPAAAPAAILLDDFTTPQFVSAPADLFQTRAIPLSDGPGLRRVLLGSLTDDQRRVIGSVDINSDGRGLLVGSVSRLEPLLYPRGARTASLLSFSLNYDGMPGLTNLSEGGVNDALFVELRRLDYRVGSVSVDVSVDRYRSPSITLPASDQPVVLAFPVDPRLLTSVGFVTFLFTIEGASDIIDADPGVYLEIDRFWVGAIPEPTGAALAAAGASMCAARRRRA